MEDWHSRSNGFCTVYPENGLNKSGLRHSSFIVGGEICGGEMVGVTWCRGRGRGELSAGGEKISAMGEDLCDTYTVHIRN